MAPAAKGCASRIERHSALIGALTVLAVLSACSGKAPGTTAAAGNQAGTPGASWYQLRAGAFQPVAGPGAAATIPLKVWTVQERIADMAFLGDTLYCAVNGSGLAAVSLDAAGSPTFASHADALIFEHRTITTLVPRDGTVAVHLYYNSVLNDARPEELQLSGISLVTFLPGQSNYAFVIPPFQRRNADWEAAGFAAESENSFDIEWKHTDATETRFAYTRFHADTRAEEPVTRDTYMAALGVPSIAGPGVPADLAAFFEDCRTRIPSLGPETAVQFFLRSRENPVRRSYRSRPVSDDVVLVPVFEQAGIRSALLPDGTVRRRAAGAAVTTMKLPALPDGFRYTDIARLGSVLVVPWEEASFTEVGRAGLLLLRQP